MTRTGCGGLGVSATRSNRLIFAVGAITSVPLGSDFEAWIPYDLANKAEDAFRQRDPQFEFMDLPVEIRSSGETRIRYGGRFRLGVFEVWVHHGHRVGIPGVNECVSVARKGACGVVDANTSALFLDSVDR